ncbi:MAG: DUF262 domain-containing protein [Dysgonamonadaceae bacterium]|jgi:hypothetical protein|nr:DUF262 domain-containing protein [Dysgonamonadaceae bacterium]
MSENKQQFEKLSFRQLLESRKVEIPIIQRDYAQGRAKQEKVRNEFLDALKEALTGTPVELDFVYGSEKENTLQPLDGQQRLTTLFLLHWFIANKEGKLGEAKFLSEFTYETRTSSREFCKELVDKSIDYQNLLPINNDAVTAENQLSETIKNAAWFVESWQKDPTISAMLIMLDAIQAKFKDTSDIWGKLTETAEDKRPITFLYIKLETFGLSDDLYIKMNARGKQLTNFENFKADLVGHIKGWDKNEGHQNTIAHKLDTTWTDIFRKNNKDSKIDEIYFAFLNRYFLNALITTMKDEKCALLSAEKIEKNKSFRVLYGNKGYESFDACKDFGQDVLASLTKTLDSLKYISNTDIANCFPEWVEKDKFYFIPQYDNNSSITGLTQPQKRVIVHAICRYCENEQYNKTTFKQWMRIVWNTVENTEIGSVPAMIGTMRLIDELGNHSHEIYSWLANDANKITSEIAKKQVKEEREKAKQILDENGNLSIDKNSEIWEQKIIDAENTAFFKGAIRFMFTNENGSYDWSLFDGRLENSKKYFDKEGVIEEYKTDALLLRVLITKFTEWDNFTDIHYDNNVSTWKNDLLISRKQIKAICHLFNESDVSSIDLANFTSSLTDRIKLFHEDLVQTPLLSQIVPGCMFHWRNYGGRYSLYPYNTKAQWKIYVLADNRNGILSKLNVESNNKRDGVPYFWGWEIYYKHNGKEYKLWDNLQVKNDKGNWEEVKDTLENPITLDNLEEYLTNL